MDVDPVKKILMALDDAKEVQDSTTTEEIYSRLRSLLQQKCARNPAAIYVLDRYREKPDIWEAPLRDELRQANADQDEKLLQMAEQLISLEHTKQQAIFERISAESASLCKTLQCSNQLFRTQFEQRLRFGLLTACIGLLGLLVTIFTLSKENMRLVPSILITIFVVEALSVLFLIHAKNILKYIFNNNEQLLNAEGMYKKIELVASTDGKIRKYISRSLIDQLLKL